MEIFEENGKFGLRDENGKIVLPCEYTVIANASFFTDCYFLEKEGKKGLADRKDGSIVMPCKYDNCYYTIGRRDIAGFGCYIVSNNGKYGIYNIDERKELLPCEYDSFECAEFHRVENQTIVKKGDKFGLCDEDGKFTIPCECEDIEIHTDFYNFYLEELEFVTFKQNGKYGVCNRKGEIIIPCEYDSIVSYAGIVKKDEKYGFDNGHIKIPCMYEELTGQLDQCYLYPVRVNDKWGVVDKNNNIVVPIDYDEIRTRRASLFHKSKGIIVIKDGKFGVYDERGQEVLPCENSYTDEVVDKKFIEIYQHLMNVHQEIRNVEHKVNNEDSNIQETGTKIGVGDDGGMGV